MTIKPAPKTKLNDNKRFFSPFKRNSALFLLLLFIGTSVHAQWAQEKGKGYYKVGVWWLEADEHYTNVGAIDPNATRGLFISSFFGRYGLNEDLTVVGYIPHTRVYQNSQVF